MPSWLVGERTSDDAEVFLTDLASRMRDRIQLSTDGLAHAVSLHFMHYNFARPHSAVKDRYSRTPAMVAGVADHVWSLEEIAALLD